jgi:hypothetical protein
MAGKLPNGVRKVYEEVQGLGVGTGGARDATMVKLTKKRYEMTGPAKRLLPIDYCADSNAYKHMVPSLDYRGGL